MSKKPRLTQGTRKHIECELIAYHETCKAIQDLRAEIIEGTPVIEGRRGSGPGDTTYYKAARLHDDRLLRELTKIADAITLVYNKLPQEKRELIKLRYWDRHYTNYGIAYKLGVSERTYRYWKNEILEMLALELGWR